MRDGDGRPEVEVYLDTRGPLGLADVGRFLQQLEVVARRASGGGARTKIEIVELELGSLRTKIMAGIAGASLAVDAGELATNIADALKTNPPAAKATLALIQNSPNATVNISGGGLTIKPFRAEDVRAAADLGPAPQRQRDLEILSGPQGGYIRRIQAEYFVELDSRPNLLIKIDDQRDASKAEPFENGMRYTLEGEAHIGSHGRPSFFIVSRAILLG